MISLLHRGEKKQCTIRRDILAIFGEILEHSKYTQLPQVITENDNSWLLFGQSNEVVSLQHLFRILPLHLLGIIMNEIAGKNSSIVSSHNSTPLLGTPCKDQLLSGLHFLIWVLRLPKCATLLVIDQYFESIFDLLFFIQTLILQEAIDSDSLVDINNTLNGELLKLTYDILTKLLKQHADSRDIFFCHPHNAYFVHVLLDLLIGTKDNDSDLTYVLIEMLAYLSNVNPFITHLMTNPHFLNGDFFSRISSILASCQESTTRSLLLQSLLSLCEFPYGDEVAPEDFLDTVHRNKQASHRFSEIIFLLFELKKAENRENMYRVDDELEDESEIHDFIIDLYSLIEYCADDANFKELILERTPEFVLQLSDRALTNDDFQHPLFKRIASLIYRILGNLAVRSHELQRMKTLCLTSFTAPILELLKTNLITIRNNLSERSKEEDRLVQSFLDAMNEEPRKKLKTSL